MTRGSQSQKLTISPVNVQLFTGVTIFDFKLDNSTPCNFRITPNIDSKVARSARGGGGVSASCSDESKRKRKSQRKSKSSFQIDFHHQQSIQHHTTTSASEARACESDLQEKRRNRPKSNFELKNRLIDITAHLGTPGDDSGAKTRTLKFSH